MEHSEAPLSGADVRSGRRAALAFRVVFYGGALVAAIVLLTGRASGGEVAKTLEGGTAQLKSMEMSLDEDGNALSFDTEVHQECGGGGWHETRWFPGPGDPARFDQDGDELKVEETWRNVNDGDVERGRATMHATVTASRVAGTIRVVTEWSRDGRRYATCTSDAVAFNVGAGR